MAALAMRAQRPIVPLLQGAAAVPVAARTLLRGAGDGSGDAVCQRDSRYWFNRFS